VASILPFFFVGKTIALPFRVVGGLVDLVF
jgi:hypothetical protein